jgi:NAD(P)-dependent dehydrogenase (short-subunit alcohol dehydrogenase family)
MRLDGKVALITGAASGMGASMARIFAREGAKVVVADQLDDDGKKIAAEIVAANGAASFHHLDVTNEANWKDAVAATVKEFGKLDILVNNAGISGSAVDDLYDTEAWDKIMDVNARGAFFGMKYAIPEMRKVGGGAIVNISSMAAVAASNLIAYGMSKAGVNKLTRATAAGNTRYMIRCNCIMPGLMDTPMAVGGRAASQGRPTEEIRAGRDAQVPLGHKMGTGWDVAYAALFLASDEAKFITGAILPVDGGMSAGVG